MGTKDASTQNFCLTLNTVQVLKNIALVTHPLPTPALLQKEHCALHAPHPPLAHAKRTSKFPNPFLRNAGLLQ